MSHHQKLKRRGRWGGDEGGQMEKAIFNSKVPG
jgi:hypothetical protein